MTARGLAGGMTARGLAGGPRKLSEFGVILLLETCLGEIGVSFVVLPKLLRVVLFTPLRVVLFSPETVVPVTPITPVSESPLSIIVEKQVIIVVTTASLVIRTILATAETSVAFMFLNIKSQEYGTKTNLKVKQQAGKSCVRPRNFNCQKSFFFE